MQALEAQAHPGVSTEIPDSQREFLETESGQHPAAPVSGAGEAEGKSVGTLGENGTEGDASSSALRAGGARVAIYPARNGHASYHMAKR